MPNTAVRFQVAEVNAAVAGTEFSGHIRHLPTIPSTNDLALAAARAGARTGVWIADEQTAGRGRGSHVWHSAKGAGLYMSVLVSPAVPMQSMLQLSLRAAIAVQSAIASTTGFRVRDEIDIRWPNDLMLNGRKCGGILIDTAARSASAVQPAMLRHAVIGIGINVNHLAFPAALDSIATSLRRELPPKKPGAPAPPLRREPLAAAILLALAAELGALATGKHQPEAADPTRYSSWIEGKRVRIESRAGDANAAYTGTTAGLDPQGFLRVLDDTGQLRTILSGGLREL
ncbi:MAG TPA: biotin--[acetyl-CoA-carboxylase] ligase [Acidobacteriaceae bacterium]|jgi:BirA family biotin operon repressor/biotin-[acetyl-CoA-carboxylase] ligase|nr:biotin--[acetyl-CoA-carboxylase] ligase [Acidobacteriaceae bacterium]